MNEHLLETNVTDLGEFLSRDETKLIREAKLDVLETPGKLFRPVSERERATEGSGIERTLLLSEVFDIFLIRSDCRKDNEM